MGPIASGVSIRVLTPVLAVLGLLAACSQTPRTDGGANGPVDPPMSPPPSRAPNGGAGGPPEPMPTPASAPSSSVRSFGARVVSGSYQVSALAGPRTGASVVRVFRSGDLVAIVCVTRGDLVSSRVDGSVSDLWDRVVSGGYLPDVNLDRGSNNAVVPECSG
jgi:hypothetical protein